MQRFFLCHDDHMPAPEESWGNWHFIALDSHGPAGANWNLIVLADKHIQANPDWIPFPSLYDAKTTLRASKVPEQVLADLGLTGDETTIEAAVIFGEINSMLAP